MISMRFSTTRYGTMKGDQKACGETVKLALPGRVVQSQGFEA